MDWFEMFVFCFPSDKKAISYKLEFQFQVILPNREGFLDRGDRKTVCISGDQLQGMDHHFNSLFLLFHLVFMVKRSSHSEGRISSLRKHRE